jgi:hypothetical protein
VWLQSSHLFPIFETVLALGHVEDHGVSMKLGRSIAIDGPRGIVLKGGGDEFAGRLRGMDIADPRLRVSFKFLKCRAYALPMGFPHPIIAAYESGERYRLRRGKCSVPPGTMLDAGHLSAKFAFIGSGNLMPYKLLFGVRMLAFTQPRKVFGTNATSEHDFASTLLSRMPRYVDSNNFLQPMARVRTSLRRLRDGQVSSSSKHQFATDRPSWQKHHGEDFWVKRLVWPLFREPAGLDSLKLSQDACSQSWGLASSDPEEALKAIEKVTNAERGWMIVAAGMAATNPAAALKMYRERVKVTRPNPRNSEDEESRYLLLAIILEEIGRTDHGRLREALRDESLLTTTKNAYEFGKSLVTIIDAIAPYDFGLAVDLTDRIKDTSCRSTALCKLVQAAYLSHDAVKAKPHYQSILARIVRLPNDDRRGVYATFVEATAADASVPNKIVVDLMTHLAAGERDGFMYSLPRFVEAIYHRTPQVLQQLESELHGIEMMLAA